MCARRVHFAREMTMGNIKISVTSQDGSITVEGSQDELKDYLSADPMVSSLLQRLTQNPSATSPDDQTKPHEAALDHAWEWFSLHAGQRMQAVNFYLVAAAFLSNAYVNALKDTNFVVAAGVGILGAFIAFIFFMLEQRVRTLVRAGETALKSGERQLANDSEIPAIEILTEIETPEKWTWSYSKAFRYLYGLTGLGFLAGAAYSIVRFYMDRSLTIDYALSVGCVGGVALLAAGCFLLNRAAHKPNRAVLTACLISGLACLSTGIGMLSYSFCHALNRGL